MRPALTCCTAIMVNKPSGVKWAHSRYCETAANATIDTPKRRLASVPSSPVDEEASSPGLTRVKDRLAHPACIAAANDGATPCSRCSWLLEDGGVGQQYTEFWIDRDDDV